MGSHPTSPVKVTDLLLNMISKAATRDDAFLLEIMALQEKHVATAKKLLDNGTEQGKQELASFSEQLTKDIDGIKSILRAIMAGLPLPVSHSRSIC
jgi:bifunctional aspartokinase / homoserine dehydrogenase 1